MHHIHSLLTYRVIVCPEATVSKKKRVCVRIVPVGSVETAVLDIKLTAKSKMMLQHYTFVGYIQIHGLLSWACFIKAFSWTFMNIMLHIICNYMHFFFRDIHGYVLWYRKGYFSKPTPQAKPRSVSLDIRQLSLEQQSPPLPLRPRYKAYVYLKWRCYYQNVTYVSY